MARVIIPTNPDDIIALAKGILAKHTADGAASPLSGLDMTDFAAKVTAADTQNQASAKAYRDAELANKGNEQKLGDWQFTVDQSAQSSAAKASAKPKTP
jgi:hypothetical protein